MAGAELRQFWRDVFAAADCALEMEVAERKAFVDLQRRETPRLGNALAKLRIIRKRCKNFEPVRRNRLLVVDLEFSGVGW